MCLGSSLFTPLPLMLPIMTMLPPVFWEIITRVAACTTRNVSIIFKFSSCVNLSVEYGSAGALLLLEVI